MSRFFTRERFGHPQFLAGMLLLLFLAQCLWLVSRKARSGQLQVAEVVRIRQGLEQWHGHGIAGTPSCQGNENLLSQGAAAPWEFANSGGYDPYHSPLWYLTASAPFVFLPMDLRPDAFAEWAWLARVPYLIFGLLLGASLWYVARRLYGNAGGYIALVLYCFSPAVIRTSALWFAQPEAGAAWGAFGTIFTAIAVAHTLYAPREVVLWNWRRILLLGLSVALAVGSQFSLIIVVPASLAFMLYLAPARRGPAAAIWAAACVIAFLLLFAAYFFHGAQFQAGLRHASFLGYSGHAFTVPGAYLQMVAQLGQNSPALLIAVPAALVAFALWPRARYFGNCAPLVIAILLLALAVGTPHHPGLGFHFVALPFLFLFVAGVSADLLETRQRSLVMSSICGLLAANAFWNLAELARTGWR
ncbi:MAG TPA: hypothetical protein VLW25_04155 [Bryobacteraceae bacterium]|nr:hypothetical protein [Bryobacteraceae bacterium]